MAQWKDFVLALLNEPGFTAFLGTVVGGLVTIAGLFVVGRLERRAEEWRRRSDILSAAYAAFDRMVTNLRHYSSADGAVDEKQRRARRFWNAATSFATGFNKARFWLEPRTLRMLDDALKQFRDAGYALDEALAGNDVSTNRQNATSFITTEAPRLRAMIELEMRRAIPVA